MKIKEYLSLFNEITIYAAALSFYTIFALIPIILLILSLFSFTPLFNDIFIKVQEFITSNILPNNQKLLIEYLNHFLQNSSKMGVIGGFYLVITSILFFDNYETIISKIFEVKKRDFIEKIKLYWTLLTFIPIIFAFAIFLMFKIQDILNSFSYLSWIKIVYLLPYFLLYLAFFLSYILTIYKRNIKLVLIVSFFITLLFIIFKSLFAYYIILNKTYTTLYGSISTIIFIFLWIYISWIIYIAGLYLIKFSYNFNQKGV